MMHIHPQARTTPPVLAEIARSTAPIGLARAIGERSLRTKSRTDAVGRLAVMPLPGGQT